MIDLINHQYDDTEVVLADVEVSIRYFFLGVETVMLEKLFWSYVLYSSVYSSFHTMLFLLASKSLL